MRDFLCTHGKMIHVQLEVMRCYWCGRYMYGAICSLQLYTVINVHSVHSVRLLMWLICIKRFPISQSQTVPSSYSGGARSLLSLYAAHLLHVNITLIQTIIYFDIQTYKYSRPLLINYLLVHICIQQEQNSFCTPVKEFSDLLNSLMISYKKLL